VEASSEFVGIVAFGTGPFSGPKILKISAELPQRLGALRPAAARLMVAVSRKGFGFGDRVGFKFALRRIGETSQDIALHRCPREAGIKLAFTVSRA
jgi:hypothetical protein